MGPFCAVESYEKLHNCFGFCGRRHRTVVSPTPIYETLLKQVVQILIKIVDKLYGFWRIDKALVIVVWNINDWLIPIHRPHILSQPCRLRYIYGIMVMMQLPFQDEIDLSNRCVLLLANEVGVFQNLVIKFVLRHTIPIPLMKPLPMMTSLMYQRG